MRGANAVVVSEPFANKHHVKRGDSITLSLGGAKAAFRVVDVYYDYSSERGTVVMDRATALKYLPDPAPSSLAIYVSPDASLAGRAPRNRKRGGAGNHRILIFSNRDLRTQALMIFDRTFAITYALEAVAVIVAVIGCRGCAACGRDRSAARTRAAAISGRGVVADSQIDFGRGGAARLARDAGRSRAGIRALADFGFCDQQAVVWLDDTISLAGGDSARRADACLRRDGARRACIPRTSRFD